MQQREKGGEKERRKKVDGYIKRWRKIQHRKEMREERKEKVMQKESLVEEVTEREGKVRRKWDGGKYSEGRRAKTMDGKKWGCGKVVIWEKNV